MSLNKSPVDTSTGIDAPSIEVIIDISATSLGATNSISISSTSKAGVSAPPLPPSPCRAITYSNEIICGNPLRSSKEAVQSLNPDPDIT